MRNIYKITKGQLVSIWIFGVIGFFLAVDQADYSGSGFATFLAVLIPALLIFYTIGWRAFNKIDKENINFNFKFNISSILPSKKKFIIFVISITLVIAVVACVSYFLNTKKENLRKEQLRQDYNEAILKVDSLKEQVTACIKPVIEKKYQEEVRSCNLLKNKIKHDYDFCLTLAPVTSSASCLYENDYQIIDCSEETLNIKARSKIIESDVPQLCREAVDELKNVNSIIESYFKLNNNL